MKYLRVFFGSFIPSTDSQQRLQFRIQFFQTDETSVGSFAEVIVQFVERIQRYDGVLFAVKPGEAEDHVRADVRINVLDVEQAIAVAIHRPGTKVANDFFLFL